MNADHLRKIIIETLERAGLYSPQAVELLMGTAAVESDMGQNWLQLGGGPGLGVFQVEPETMWDNFHNYLDYRPELKKRALDSAVILKQSEFALMTNIAFQVLMARVKYLRVKAPLPQVDDLGGQAAYWRQHYNAASGNDAIAIEKFKKKYRRYVLA